LIFITNFEVKQESIIELSKNKNNLIIDCLNGSTKKIRFLIYNAITGTSNILSHGKQQIIIRDSNKLDNELLNFIFSNSRNKDIYLINLNPTQERFLFKNHRNKYRYYEGAYDPSKDNFFIYLKKILFQNENRYKLLDEFESLNEGTILDFIGYNLPMSNLDNQLLLDNYDILNNLYKYKYKVKREYILNIITKLLNVPSFGVSIGFPPKKAKIKKKKKKDKKMTNNDAWKLASKKMVNYFKNKDNYFKEDNEIKEGGLF
jgi:hypothetical protein